MTALPAEGCLTYEQVATRATELLTGWPVGGPDSAAAMAHLVDETYGRLIIGPDTDCLAYRIDEIGVRFTDTGMNLDIRVGATVGPCPECAVGKHPNCDGRSWDVQRDEPAPCPCAGRGHA